MHSRRTQTAAVLAFVLAATLQVPGMPTDSWPRFIPKKERSGIFKDFNEASGMGAAFATQTESFVVWLSDPMARAVISQMIDDERLSNKEADERYAAFRRASYYNFLVSLVYLGDDAAGELAVSQEGGPFTPNQIFLQRKEDKNVFSRGEVVARPFDVQVGRVKMKNAYLLHFPRMTSDGAPLIRAQTDKLTIQYKIGDKVVALTFDLADWFKNKKLATLDDL